jgi:hypothetical protein
MQIKIILVSWLDLPELGRWGLTAKSTSNGIRCIVCLIGIGRQMFVSPLLRLLVCTMRRGVRECSMQGSNELQG